MNAERGLPIMRATNCKVGTHTYVVFGGSQALPAADVIPTGQPCDCGLYEWAGLDAPLASVPRGRAAAQLGAD